ncbi:MAG: hypothetical protein M3362_05275, partial [Acidobacteriota bacterium]|nr:hypothetical protein [Acidobacteriota bacterium]
ESETGLEVESEYSITVKSPDGDYWQDSSVKWSREPADFDFVLNWAIDYREQLDARADLSRIDVKETWTIYKVSDPAIKRTWSASYRLSRDLRESSKMPVVEVAQIQNKEIVAPVRGPILEEIRKYIIAKKTKRN